MSSPPNGASFFHAGGAIAGATGATITANGLSFSKVGVGVYLARLTQGIAATEAISATTLRGGPAAADTTISVDHTTDFEKTISVTIGGAPADVDLDVQFLRVRVGS